MAILGGSRKYKTKNGIFHKFFWYKRKYAHYFWNNSGGIFDLSSLAVLIWPISAIAGVAWGFSKNQPAFAYGVMVWGSMVIIVTGFIAFIGYAF